jgi:hypothetical protein
VTLKGYKKEKSGTTLFFPICICTATANATNSHIEDISLAKLFLVLIQAHKTPCILVQVIVSKKLVIGDKIPPSPVLVSRHSKMRTE